MTRSVEIPDEAVEAAAETYERVGDTRIEAMYAALSAALPYLVPAVPACPCSVDVSTEQGIPDRLVADGDCPLHGEGSASAEDGGLREALEKLVAKWDVESGSASYQWLSWQYLKPLLAAHPAAHAVSVDTAESTASTSAVPQPAARKKLTAMLSDMIGQWDDLPEATRNRRAAALVREIQPFLAPQPAERTRHAIWRAVYDAATEQGLQPSGIADKATEAVLALSPQPVDREALSAAVYEKAAAVELEGGYITTLIAPEDAVAAVLAVLAGEQEQVESQQ